MCPQTSTSSRVDAGAAGLGARLVVASGLLTVGVAALAAGLAPVHLWLAPLVLPATVLLAGASWRLTRDVVAARSEPRADLAVLVVGVVAAAWTASTHSERVVVFRDPSSYLQTAVSLSRFHSTPFPVDPESVGGAAVLSLPGVSLSSAAFFQVGPPTSPGIEPQFLIGAPAWYSLGNWLGGPVGMWLVAAVFVGVGVAGFGILVGQVVGRWWGVVAAVTLASAYPTIHSGRATYSEPVSFVAVVAGLMLLFLVVREETPSGAAWKVPVLITAGELIRLDALRETMLLLPVIAWLYLRGRRAEATSMARTTVMVSFACLLVWLSQSKSYLIVNKSSMLPLIGLTLVIACAAVAAVVLVPRRRSHLPARWRESLPWVGATLVLLVAVGLVTRPLWLVARQAEANPLLEQFQAAQGIPVDGRRTYAENSLVWTTWWLGPVAVGAGLVVAVALTWVGLRPVSRRRPAPPWVALLWVVGASSLLTWLRPGVVPDHPWADRRLFVLLPFVIALAVTGFAWVFDTLGRHHRRERFLAIPVALVVLVIPAVRGSAPHATERQQVGSVDQVSTVCRSFSTGEVAIAGDARSAYSWPQLLRGMCGVPVLTLDTDTLASPGLTRDRLAAVVEAVRSAGKRPVLLTEHAETARAICAELSNRSTLVDLVTTTDQSTILTRPDGTAQVRIDLVASR